MNGEVVKKWIIAELNAATLTGTPRIRSAQINDLQSEEGVYVALGGGGIASRRIADDQDFRIVIVRTGEQNAHTTFNEIRDLFVFTPGESRAWAVEPSTKNLRLRDIQILSGIQPESAGPNNPIYRAVLIFNVRGRDTRRT